MTGAVASIADGARTASRDGGDYERAARDMLVAMNTRAIAIVALVIAVIVLLILLL